MALSKIFYSVTSKALSDTHDRFFDAVQDGNVAAVRRILDEHPDAASWYKQNPTRADPYRRRFRDRLADISGVKPEHFVGHCALGIAAIHGQHAVVELLLDHGAPVDQRSKKGGYTPLALADFYFDQNAPLNRQAAQTDTIRALLNRGANPNVTVKNLLGGQEPALRRNRSLLNLLRRRNRQP